MTHEEKIQRAAELLDAMGTTDIRNFNTESVESDNVYYLDMVCPLSASADMIGWEGLGELNQILQGIDDRDHLQQINDLTTKNKITEAEGVDADPERRSRPRRGEQ